MGNLLEVYEYDLITCNPDYRDDPEYQYLDAIVFLELEQFILSNIDDQESDTTYFFRLSNRRHVGKIIQAKNYVGLVQLKSGHQIQILPKASSGSSEEMKKTFIKMLRSMKDFPSKVLQDANLKMDRMSIYEIFINMYIQEVRHLLKVGLRSSYVGVEENINYFKGKLLINPNIRSNLVHKERFYVAFDELNVNRPENRLIKATLLKLQKLSNNNSNIKEIRQLLSHFELIKTSINYVKDFSLVHLDRNSKNYELLMQWSKVFLLNRSFTTFTGNTTARALLFPMEKVFEAYIARNLRKVLADLPWEVSAQDKGYYLFNNPQNFALRPDIVITRQDKSMVVLDTKWKMLSNHPASNYGIAQSDMYQMYAYSKKYKTPEIIVIYPKTDGLEEMSLNFESYVDGVEVETKVSLFFVDITNVEESLMKLREELNK